MIVSCCFVGFRTTFGINHCISKRLVFCIEKRINIRASDYRFADKKKYYTGFTTSKGGKKATEIVELVELANKLSDFTETEIKKRNNMILDRFIEYLRANNLLAQSNR